jgi:hypothetical protein
MSHLYTRSGFLPNPSKKRNKDYAFRPNEEESMSLR